MDTRKEFERLKRKGILAEKCGTVCVCCGAMEGIAYHHILPIVMGGDNRFSNIVPVCEVCHGKVHGTHMTCLHRYVKNTGRPKKDAPKGYEKVSMDYVWGRITGDEVRKVLGMKKGARITDSWWFKELMDKEGIASYKKSVSRWDNVITSRIWYKNGDYLEVYRDGEEEWQRGKYTEEEIRQLTSIKRTHRPDKELIKNKN